MDIKQMQYLLAVYNNKNITLAAAQNYISPQALSKTIKMLEKEYQNDILIRKGKQIEFTEFGLALVHESRKILNSLDVMEQNLNMIKNATKSKLKISAACTITHILGYELFEQFSKKYPNIHLEISEYADIFIDQMVLNEECDVAFAIDIPENQELYHIYPLKKLCFCAVVNQEHPYATKTNITLEDLATQPIITRNAHYKGFLKLEHYAKQKGINLNYALCSPDDFLWLSMLRKNKGIGIAVDQLIQEDNFNLVSIPLLNNQLTWNINIITKKMKPQNQIIGQFIQFILEHVK